MLGNNNNPLIYFPYRWEAYMLNSFPLCKKQGDEDVLDQV